MKPTKDNWIKAFDREFYEGVYAFAESTGEPYDIDKEIKSFISQVENDAIEKTNKRWRERIEKKRNGPITDFGDSYWRGVGREETLSDLLEDKESV